MVVEVALVPLKPNPCEYVEVYPDKDVCSTSIVVVEENLAIAILALYVLEVLFLGGVMKILVMMKAKHTRCFFV